MSDGDNSHDVSYIYIEESAKSTLVLRNHPKIMNDQVSQVEWESFCDQLDSALSPIAGFKRNRMIINLLCQLNLVVLFIDFTLTQVILHDSFVNSSNVSSGNGTAVDDLEEVDGLQSFFQAYTNENSSTGDVVLLSHFIVTGVICLVTLFYINIWKQFMGQSIKKNIQSICAAFTLQKPSLMFSVKNYNKDRQLKQIINKRYSGDTFCCCSYSVVLPIYIEVSLPSGDKFIDEEDPLFEKTTEIMDDSTEFSATSATSRHLPAYDGKNIKLSTAVESSESTSKDDDDDSGNTSGGAPPPGDMEDVELQSIGSKSSTNRIGELAHKKHTRRLSSSQSGKSSKNNSRKNLLSENSGGSLRRSRRGSMGASNSSRGSRTSSSGRRNSLGRSSSSRQIEHPPASPLKRTRSKKGIKSGQIPDAAKI